MKRLIFWGTILAGGTAAYLAYKRGESLPAIAKRTFTNPLGAFASEIKQAI
ncbi:MAG: hypothetical protein ACRYFU_24035 [Janthinobacterium lividum]